jgi:hypothetical protein
VTVEARGRILGNAGKASFSLLAVLESRIPSRRKLSTIPYKVMK